MCNPTDEISDVDPLCKQLEQLPKDREELPHQLHAYENTVVRDAKSQLPLEVNRITRGVVHDLRSSFGIIRNHIGFLEEDLKDNPSCSDLITISRSLDFCDLVLGNLATLGEENIVRPQKIDIQTAIENVYAILERRLANVMLSIEIDPKVRYIWIDESQIKQLFMNLIKNAGEAMPEGGHVMIHAQYDDKDKCLHLEIQDTGCGIAPEYQERLFRDLFTTKKRGYGLGLYIVGSIVKHNKGTVKVESEVGKGTKFIIRLPVVIGENDD